MILPKIQPFKTRREKALAALWLLMPVTIGGAVIYAGDIVDVWGRLLVGCLPAALLADMSVLLTMPGERRPQQFAIWLWGSVGMVALVAAIMFANGQHPEAIQGAEVGLAYVMLVMGFPLVLLGTYAVMVMPLPWGTSGSMLGLITLWGVFLVIGYVQWVMLVPWLWRKWKGPKLESGDSPNARW